MVPCDVSGPLDGLPSVSKSRRPSDPWMTDPVSTTQSYAEALPFQSEAFVWTRESEAGEVKSVVVV